MQIEHPSDRLRFLDHEVERGRDQHLKNVKATRSSTMPSQSLVRLFGLYTKRYLARHFHSVRFAVGGRPHDVRLDAPLIIYLNHSSWWDPLVCVLVAGQFFGERNSFAPMDAAQLEKYRFFKKIGFFGVEQGTRKGAVRFLEEADAILRRPRAALWITPQGRFCDVRERPVKLRPGLAHIAARFPSAYFLPMAIEYSFWDQRLPEVLIRYGPVLSAESQGGRSPDEWSQTLSHCLEATQEKLAEEVKSRDPVAFETILEGNRGVGGFYDLWRRCRSIFRGEPLQLEHGGKGS